MFNWDNIRFHDCAIAKNYLGDLRDPDYSFLPGPDPYQFRWYLTGQYQATGNVFLHIMTRSDPQENLFHDHNWDNMTVVLAGAIDEYYINSPVENDEANGKNQRQRFLEVGHTVLRAATVAHRLVLPSSEEYAMTLFMTGPKVRQNRTWRVG